MGLLHEKIKKLSNRKLIQLSKEIQLSVIPEDALIREVVKGTEVETPSRAVILAVFSVGAVVAWELGERLEDEMNENEEYERQRNINME